MKRVIADTNYYLRFLLNDVPSQKKKAEKLFIDAKSGSIEITIPHIIIFEIEFTLNKYYHFARDDISSKIKSLLNAQYFQISERAELMKALDTYVSRNISFVDSFLLSFAEIKNFEFFSFDRKLLKMKL